MVFMYLAVPGAGTGKKKNNAETLRLSYSAQLETDTELLYLTIPNNCN